MKWIQLPDLSKPTLIILLVVGVGIAAAAVTTTSLSQNDDGAIINETGGPAVNLTGNTDVYPTTGGSSGRVQWNTTAGNASFESSGDTSVTIATGEITGNWTNVSAVDASNADLTVNPADKEEATVSGGVTGLSFRDANGVGLDDGTPDLVYSASSNGNVTLNNLPASTTFRARTGSGADLGEVTTDASGSGTVSLQSGSNTEVYLFTNDAPQFDQSSASPEDGAKLSDSQLTMSINVSDADFSTDQGDTVEVTFYVDGSSIATKQVSSNSTVSATTEISLGGSHTWHAEATDSYGGSNTSAERTFYTPSTLYIRSESQPDKLVNSTTVNITAYSSDRVERRNVSDGTLNLTGFPVNEPIIVRANATNYTMRTAVIESIYEQNSIYLLNESIPQYLIRFQLQQLTGDYPEEDTVLFVERDIKLNGSVEWRTVAGDNFGVKGIPTNLKQDERYRLRIKNLETSQTAVIGSYTAIQSETVTVSAGSAKIDVYQSNKTYGWAVSENESAQNILVEYKDKANQTESIKVTVHERFNDSNVIADNVTFTDTNELLYQIPLTADQTNKTWTAELYIDRGNGYRHFRVPIGGGPTALLPSNLDGTWVSAIGVFVMLISGMAFSRLNQGAGAISTVLVGGILWQVGILSGMAIGASIVAALAVSLIYHYRSGGGV